MRSISRILTLIACATLATGGIARADAWVYAKGLSIYLWTPSSANCTQTWDHFRCKTDKGREAHLIFEYAVNRIHLHQCVIILSNRGSLWKGDIWRATAQYSNEGTCIVDQRTANVFEVFRPQDK